MLVIVVSRVLIRPALKLVARFGGREVFTAAALLVVIGAALLMEAIGLSMSLGAFLAGVLLADSEFRHELEADVEPFKGLLLGLFFMAVGMSANLALFVAHPAAVLGVAIGMMVLKALLLYAIMRATKAGNEDAQRVAGAARRRAANSRSCCSPRRRSTGILATETAQFLVLAVTISMLLAPLTFVAHERLLERWLERRKPPEFDFIDGPGQPRDHRRLRTLRTDRLARAADGGHSVHGDRNQLPAGRFRAQVRQQGLLRRCVAPRAPRIGAGARREALRARDRRCRSVGEDGGAGAEAFSRACRSSRARATACITIGCAISTSEASSGTRFARASRPRARRWRCSGSTPAQAARAVDLFRRHDLAQLDIQYAVRQDEAQLIQTAAQAAAQLQELFESDVKESAELASVEETPP